MTVKIGFHARLAPALLLTALIVPASIIDLRHRIIPNAINFPGAVAVYLTAVIAQPDRWAELLIGGVAAALFLGVAWMIYPAGMGLGDVKMTLMIGLGLGLLRRSRPLRRLCDLAPAVARRAPAEGPARPQGVVPVRPVPGPRGDGRDPVGPAAVGRVVRRLMGTSRTAVVLFLGLLGSIVVYSLMMAFGDPALELVVCAAWMPLYLIAYAAGFGRAERTATADGSCRALPAG